MPSPLTSSFASAAAGSNGESAVDRRGPGSSNNDWSRNRPNGATQTFRRTSTNMTTARDSAPNNPSSSNSGVYIPPHLNSSYQSAGLRNGSLGDTRYNKEQLLNIYEAQRYAGQLDRNLDDLFLGPWNPTELLSTRDLNDASAAPEVCWSQDPRDLPFGLTTMSEEEKQLFESSVNSPLKLPQSGNKDGGAGAGMGGRKTSVSGHHLGTFNPSSSNASRPGQRRRETSDSFSAIGPLSPTSNTKQFFRDEPNTSTPPPALLRRRTDLKDDTTHPPEAQKEGAGDLQDLPSDRESPFVSLNRSATGPLSSNLHTSSASPWSTGPQSSAFESMGTFGTFTASQPTGSQDLHDRRPGFGSARGGSRFKGLLAKASTEEMSSSKDKSTLGALEKLTEDEAEKGQSGMGDTFKTRTSRSETNPFENAGPRTGSAALGGARDSIGHQAAIEQLGFSSFVPHSTVGTRDLVQREVGAHETPRTRQHDREPMSPTTTNPYQSPPGDRGTEGEDDETNDLEPHPPGATPFGGPRRKLVPEGDDRSNSRSLHGIGGLSGLPGFGGSAAWSSSGTPARDRNSASGAFGDPIFSPITDLQSSTSAFGGASFFNSTTGVGAAGSARGNKLGPMFPPAMQEQMRDHGHRHDGTGDSFDGRIDSYPASISSRDPFESNRRREDLPFRGSSYLEDSAPDVGSAFTPQTSFPPSTSVSHAQAPSTSAVIPQRISSTADTPGGFGQGLSQSSESSNSNQLPAAQQRQMVMPDRMRWVYRDPQGKRQGPWSGLEMHDWFKAGFFTAELQVKKLEDAEYEPLAQLVRRIGNSREPFLVPQIGVPHGPASGGQGNHWASPTLPGAGATQTGSAQPPFASSFPSFGTTLTAEQQNALERRKQEEQFLMARQKEHLAQQQVLLKQMQLQGGPHAMHSLQHHSSAPSLHSQPSFGSITSPSAYQPSPMQAPIQPPQNLPGILEGSVPQPPTSGATGYINDHRAAREETQSSLIDRMSFNQRASYQFNPLLEHQDKMSNPRQVTSMLQDRARLHMQQQNELRNHQDAFLGEGGQNDRLREFQNYREQDESIILFNEFEQPFGPTSQVPYLDEQAESHTASGFGHTRTSTDFSAPATETNGLTLSQQVQRAAASNQQKAAINESPWNKVESTISTQHPPPLSISPLPAPAAQRNRQHVADALNAESRSQTQTPTDTPGASIAPWADKSHENAKGPSLREIQEAEARKAAEQKGIATAARLAQAEQERLNMPPQPLPAAPGLPSTSTWATSTSPATPTTPAVSAWARSASGKPAVAGAHGGTKKTLAQIQKEEESRKQRAAAAAAATAAAATAASAQGGSVMASTSGGKRYAELASKTAPAGVATPASAWTTVGSSGKAKAPATVIATPQPTTRMSGGSTGASRNRPTLQTARSSTLASQSKAADDFAKWAKTALGKGLNSNINLDDFVQSLLILPPETEIISDSVYANSQTLDGRRFAEEFIRRRKLADKGVVDANVNGIPSSAASDNKSGAGWNEVAKKGPTKEENNAAFQVVATKKKGKR